MNLVNLIVLALAAAVYPTLLAGVIVIVGRPNPLRMLIAFLLGGMSISVAAGLLILKALESSEAVSHAHASSRPILDIVIGAISLLVAWGVAGGRITGESLQRRRRARQQRKAGRERGEPASVGKSFTSRALSRGSVTMAVLAGLVLNLPGIWYLDALAGIAEAKPSTTVAVWRCCCST